VSPAHRNLGHGRALTRALAQEAHRRGFDAVWLRVVPQNAAARRAYDAAGFERATPEQEASFNIGQRRAYVWMRDRLGGRRAATKTVHPNRRSPA
jgi:ribosomal protein S18 acetylase RimI-like enzyme